LIVTTLKHPGCWRPVAWRSINSSEREPIRCSIVPRRYGAGLALGTACTDDMQRGSRDA